jgi:sensor histidine kinase YesM
MAARETMTTMSDEANSLGRVTSYKTVRIGGLAVIWVASTLLALATASECHSVFYPPSLLYGFTLWGWWGVIGSALWTLGPRHPSILRFSPAVIALHLISGCVFGLAHLVLVGALGFTETGWQLHHTRLSVWTSHLDINRFGLEILIYGFLFGMIGILHHQIRSRREAMKALELQKQLSTAQLRALQMQLEPHFLFNTLNAITTLVETGRQSEAAQMLAHLNAILKSTLKRTTPEKVLLSQELEIVENYLAIEQVRFADRLKIEIRAEPAALNSLVPCFLLQPIVENAIRHGISHCEDDGLVKASARRSGNLLHIEVRNSGTASNGRSESGNGIGLRNTRERLAHFYQDAYEMKTQPLDTGGFEVAITIPYERAR